MSRRLGPLLTLFTVSAGLLLGSAGAALAYYSASGSGTASAQFPHIIAPSGITVSQSGANVTATWSAATLSSGPAVQGYRVVRSDGTTVCGSPSLDTSLFCTDSSAASGTYTYTVTAVYNSWTAAATSSAWTVLTAPTISSKPPSVSNSASTSFGFSGGSGSAYQCQLDGAGYTACTSPAAYTGLAQGSHTFSLRSATGSSYGPSVSYTWLVDTVPPTQSLSLSGASGAYLSGSTIYYHGQAAGSFKLVSTVSDSGSGPASANFPAISANGWTHGSETVTTPSGGPYTSSIFSWTAGASNPVGYTVSAADAAGNTSGTALTFTPDNSPPTGGALTVNGTAASQAGSTSSAINSTSFAINSRSDYTDNQSGMTSSVLTVQSESLSGTTCGVPGSGGPFTSPTTVTGITQPSGIAAGYCYLYTLTGADNVGNTGSITTTVVDNTLSFKVTTQPTSVAAGTATASNAIVLTAIKNGATDTTYTGATLTWSGAANSPSATAPTLPTNPTWTSGQATFGITLVKAAATTLTVSDGTRGATFNAITVNPGTAANLAWTSVASPAGIPSPCLFTCTYASGFGYNQTWTAYVSVTDSLGNIVNNLGTGHSALIFLGGNRAGTLTPPNFSSLTIASTGPAISTTSLQYKSPASGTYTDTVTAFASGYSNATASFTK